MALLAAPVVGLGLLCGVGQMLNRTLDEPWRYQSTKPDAMTDATTTSARRRAMSGRDDLVLQCTSGRAPELAIAMGGLPASTSGKDILMRFDADPAEPRSASYNPNAIFIIVDSVLVGKLRRSKKLAIQYTPVSREPALATFDLEGLDKAYEQVSAPPCVP